jgi:hypothetical protein
MPFRKIGFEEEFLVFCLPHDDTFMFNVNNFKAKRTVIKRIKMSNFGSKDINIETLG